MERTIFHIDVNSAFLSWSAVKRLREDPTALDLRTIPSAVGGDVKTRHGIITARSIPAKRFGIRTAMPVVQALERCPSLVLVPSDFETYRTYSAAFIEILHKYAPVVEQLSIDEAFLDMSGTEQAIRSAIFEQIVAGTLSGEKATRLRSLAFPMNAAVLIKDEIRDTLGFTVNVGISSNTLLAKMASDLEKPDKIHTLYPSEIEAKMWPLPIGDLYGCGSKTAEKLRRIGIHTIGDAARLDPTILTGLLGANAGSYIHMASRRAPCLRAGTEGPPDVDLHREPRPWRFPSDDARGARRKPRRDRGGDPRHAPEGREGAKAGGPVEDPAGALRCRHGAARDENK